jgi:hypothetical protein
MCAIGVLYMCLVPTCILLHKKAGRPQQEAAGKWSRIEVEFPSE